MRVINVVFEITYLRQNDARDLWCTEVRNYIGLNLVRMGVRLPRRTRNEDSVTRSVKLVVTVIVRSGTVNQAT